MRRPSGRVLWQAPCEGAPAAPARRAGRGPERWGTVTGIRSFVAVLLPAELRARVMAAVGRLREVGAAVAWVREENLHITVRFLGHLDEQTLDRAREALEEAAARVTPFTVGLGGFGAFPSARAPRVVWVGVEAGAASLGRLHEHLEVALARRGIPPEGRPFRAHVTVGRVRPGGRAEALGPALRALGGALGETYVEAVHLMRSELAPAGARYSILARVPLAARVDAPAGGS